MASLTIAELLATRRDVMDNEVLAIYGYRPPDFAVYRTAQRVLVQVADAKIDADRQRATLAPLNPLRGEIVGLIDGWRSHPPSDRRYKRAERFDRRVGDALVAALDGDPADAKLLLERVKQDIMTIRVAGARFEYLMAAFFAGLVADALLLAIAAATDSTVAAHLWEAAAAGLVGSFFSIALAIHKRTIFTDLLWSTNVMDAMLRMVIGLIAAPLLVALVECKVISLSFGGTTPGAPCLLPAILGFVAGFAERLIPDFLAKVEVPGAGVSARPAPSDEGRPGAVADGPQGSTGATGPAPDPAGTPPIPADPRSP